MVARSRASTPVCRRRTRSRSPSNRRRRLGKFREQLSALLHGTVGQIHLVYDVIIDEYDMASGSQIELAELDIQSNGNLLGVREEITGSGLACFGAVYPNDGGSTFPVISPRIPFAPNVWHHVDVVVDLTQSPATSSFALDGVQQVSDVVIMGATFGPGSLEVGGGAYATLPTSGWKLRMTTSRSRPQ